MCGSIGQPPALPQPLGSAQLGLVLAWLSFPYIHFSPAVKRAPTMPLDIEHDSGGVSGFGSWTYVY